MIRSSQQFKGAYYFFEGLTGSLLNREPRSEDHVGIDSSTLPTKVAEALRMVDEPYLLHNRSVSHLPVRISAAVRLYAAILTYLCQHSFLLARLWAKIPLRCYPDAGVATQVYRYLYPGEQQQRLCLPRAFFARSASKCFSHGGVMFIGAFLPSVQMHAWVIEEGMHADVYDRNWINFAPIAVFK